MHNDNIKENVKIVDHLKDAADGNLTDVNKVSNEKQLSLYECKPCHYVSCVKSNYLKHIQTAKHKNMMDENNDQNNLCCEICSKHYKSRVGLWAHKKKCQNKEEIGGKEPEKINSNFKDLKQSDSQTKINKAIMNIVNENNDIKLLILEQLKRSEVQQKKSEIQQQQMMDLQKENQELINKIVEITQSEQIKKCEINQQQQMIDLQKENQELMNKMVEITQKQANTPVNVTNNTTMHNSFNLNIFLNEKCKDAMNIQEFVENLNISFQDLMHIGDEGFVTGLSDLLLSRLREMDVTKRPIHCTDLKRETMYIKENGTWDKDDRENTKLKGIIERVENKNYYCLWLWCQDNPDTKINNSNNNLLRDKIYYQTLQGDEKTRDKVIKNIAKYVVIDKKSS